jgi:hypothetical protein
MAAHIIPAAPAPITMTSQLFIIVAHHIAAYRTGQMMTIHDMLGRQFIGIRFSYQSS